MATRLPWRAAVNRQSEGTGSFVEKPPEARLEPQADLGSDLSVLLPGPRLPVALTSPSALSPALLSSGRGQRLQASRLFGWTACTRRMSSEWRPSRGMTLLWLSLWSFVLLSSGVSSARLPTAPPTGTERPTSSPWSVLPAGMGQFAGFCELNRC